MEKLTSMLELKADTVWKIVPTKMTQTLRSEIIEKMRKEKDPENKKRKI